jgi:hypothetical protein
MPSVAAAAWLSETISEAWDAIKRTASARPVPPVLRESRVVYTEAIVDARWAELDKLARDRADVARERSSELDARADRMAEILRRLDRVSDIRRQLPPPANQRSDWPQLRPRIVEGFREKGLSEAEARRAATQVGSFSLANHAEESRRRLCAAAEEISELHQDAASALCGALLAGAVSRFNRSARRHDPERTARASEEWCADVERVVRAGERRLHRAFGSGDLFRAHLQARDLAVLAESHIEEGARHAAASARRRRGTPDPFEHALARRLGDCLRQLLRGVALGTVAGHAARGNERCSPTRDWLAAAGRLEFQNPAVIPTWSVARLAQGDFPGTREMVAVEGTVSSLTITHRARKAVSLAELTGGGDHSARVALPYIKLDSGGLVPGASVRVVGDWRQTLDWLEGGSALVVDQRNVGDLSRRYWQDWVTDALRYTFQPSPHGLEMSWSWELGPDGAGNQLRFDTWAARRTPRGPDRG